MKQVLLFVFSFFTLFTLNAQVGVNEPDPSQALDVNGKIRVGNDATTPDAGTIRFDETTGQFEGFDGTEWKNLGEEKSAALPEGPVPILGSGFCNTSQTASNITFRRWENRTSFTTVPSGKYLIITSIHISPNGVTVDDTREYYMKVNPASSASGFGSGTYGITLTGNLGNSNNVVAGQSPLLILRPGEYGRIFQDNRVDNPLGLDVEIRGFLVDDLEY